MAALDSNAGQKYRAYHVLACLNRSFQQIAANLQELKKAGTVTTKQLRMLSGFAGELQADINFHALEKLHAAEREDWYRFQKMRLSRNKKRKE
jgi:hypothetical protein